MGYCVGSGGNWLWVILWGVVVILYGLFCAEWWYFLPEVSEQPIVSIYKREVFPNYR
jgi:uncharacterized membrane protein YedE/YeeE